MRRLFVVIAFGVSVLALFPSISSAAGNVLVPSDTDSGKAPNLGLLPQQDKGTGEGGDKTPPKTQPMPNWNTEVTLPQLDPLDLPPKTAAAGGFTPVPALPPADTTESAAGTRILKMANPIAESAQSVAGDTARDPNTVDLDVSPKFKFGGLDHLNIKQSLGYSSDDVSKHCHVALSGAITTPGGLSPISMNPNLMRTTFRVNGKPTSMNLIAMAFCDMLPLGKNLGLVAQVGDKYSVPLGLVTCPVPPEKMRQFHFEYNGDGKGNCRYE